VSARFLMGLFDSVYLMALTAWIGSIPFFSFVVAPVIFRVLGAEAGGKFVSALFPRYYAWGAIAGAVALPAFVAVPLCYPEYRGPLVGIQSLAILLCIMIMLYAGNGLTPAINAARDAGRSGLERLQRLHRRSVQLNSLVLVIGSGLLIAFANRQAPRTSGITELTPAERVRFDAQINQAIKDVESKYGLRPKQSHPGAELNPTRSMVDAAAVKEIESYYEQKRARELSRRGTMSASPPSGGSVRPERASADPSASAESGKR
jgi:hypothetical protein